MKIFTFITIIILCYFILVDSRRLIVIRHGEKISDDYIGLNNRGKARAQCLYQIFNDNTVFGKPRSIYSNKRGNRSHRPYDTVKPLADRYGLKVKEFKKANPGAFVKNTLNKDKSNIILLSSAREWIPSLLKAIGYRLKKEVDDFDNVWVIENDDKKGHGKLTVKKQNLEKCINHYLKYGNTNNVKSKKATTTKKKSPTKKANTKKAKKKLPREIIVSIIPTIIPLCSLNHS